MGIIKNSTLVGLLIMLFATKAFSQSLVTTDELSPSLLKETFENAYIEVLETQESYVKVKDVFTMYLDIDKTKRFVTISSTYNLVEGASQTDALTLVNKLNTEVALVKIYYNQITNTITYYYYFWTEGGFTQRSLIGAFRLYKTALSLSLQKDTEKLIR